MIILQVDIYLKLLLIKLNPAVFLLSPKYQLVCNFKSSVGKYSFLFIYHNLFLECAFILKVYQMLCVIWCNLYNLKNVKNTHGGMSLLVILQTYFTKSNTPRGCFSRFLALIRLGFLKVVFFWGGGLSPFIF